MMDFEIDDYNALRAALQEMCLAFAEQKCPEETVFNSKLVANELLSNVLQHGGGRARFRAERAGNEIKISVQSENPYRPPEKSACADTFAECGRGLFLVDFYCERRSYDERDGITVYLKIK